MSDAAQRETEKFMQGLIKRNPGEPEFQQAVREVTESLMPFLLDHPIYREARILDRMTEPDRVVIFRVCWEDDEGNIRTNRAWRVQFNNSIGPYKGGMRFHPSENLDRHRPVELRVLGLIDDPHASTAEFFEDLVVG